MEISKNQSRKLCIFVVPNSINKNSNRTSNTLLTFIPPPLLQPRSWPSNVENICLNIGMSERVIVV